MNVRSLFLLFGCGLALPLEARAQQPFVFGLDLNGYAVERESDGFAAGAGVGAMLGTGLTPRGMVLFGVDAGVAQFHSRVYRLVGHADIAARFYATRSLFAQVAFSSQGLEEPERQDNFRTGVTLGAGASLGRWEVALKHARFGAAEDWRLSLGRRYRP